MTGAGKTMTGADSALREKFGTGFLPSWEGLETSGKGKSAVLVPFFPAGSGLRLLFLRRSPDLRHHAGEVCFPGGMREPGDISPLHTALRETEEETAIRAELVEPLSVLPVEYAVVSGVAVVPVAGIVRGIDPDSDLVLSSGEIEGSVTIAIEDLSPDPGDADGGHRRKETLLPRILPPERVEDLGRNGPDPVPCAPSTGKAGIPDGRDRRPRFHIRGSGAGLQPRRGPVLRSYTDFYEKPAPVEKRTHLPDQGREVLPGLERSSVTDVVVHASYLINLAATDATGEKALLPSKTRSRGVTSSELTTSCFTRVRQGEILSMMLSGLSRQGSAPCLTGPAINGSTSCSKPCQAGKPPRCGFPGFHAHLRTARLASPAWALPSIHATCSRRDSICGRSLPTVGLWGR